MLGWLWRMIVGRFNSCEHKWEVLRRVTVKSAYSNKVIAFDYELQCERCGDIKRRRT